MKNQIRSIFPDADLASTDAAPDDDSEGMVSFDPFAEERRPGISLDAPMDPLANFDSWAMADFLGTEPPDPMGVYNSVIKHAARRYVDFVFMQEVRRIKRNSRLKRSGQLDSGPRAITSWVYDRTYGVVFFHYMIRCRYRFNASGDKNDLPSSADFCWILNNPELRQTYSRAINDWKDQGWCDEQGLCSDDVIRVAINAFMEIQQTAENFRYTGMAQAFHACIWGLKNSGKADKFFEDADTA